MQERFANLAQAIRLPDVRKRIVFVMLMFGVYVACAHVPLPGVDKEAMERLFSGAFGGGIGGLLNAFSGGSLKRFSIMALGIMPYITASIIFQLLVMAVPALEQLQKEGEWGQRKIREWTKYTTVGICVLQGFGMIGFFGTVGAFEGGAAIVGFDVMMMVAGTIFLMYIGDQITEYGIGQGVSLIIFGGIMMSLPQELASTSQMLLAGHIGLGNVLFLVALFVGMIYGIIKVQQAERKIPVQYAKRIRGTRVYGGQSSYLPLRVNQAGVMPIIFAIAVAMFPAQIAMVLSNPNVVERIARLGFTEDGVYKAIDTMVNFTSPGPSNHFASFGYFILVILFTYFYTAVTFNPEEIAENLQKNGGAVPGIRPGEKTRDYLDKILYRITLAGAVFLGVVAIMQYYVGPITGVQSFTLVGGTSLLIVVGVALDTMQQVEAQLLMRHYRGFLHT